MSMFAKREKRMLLKAISEMSLGYDLCVLLFSSFTAQAEIQGYLYQECRHNFP